MESQKILWHVLLCAGEKKGQVVTVETDLIEMELKNLPDLLIDRGFLESWSNNGEYDVYNKSIISNNNWISVEDKLPGLLYEVLLFNKEWIDEDYNPKGIRIGFLDGGHVWCSAFCSCITDYYHRDSNKDDNGFLDSKAENQIPTHWMPIPCFS
jgi:hypothetical protein